ncbi:hypothetical protein LHFGNBLO_001340 [Mesorhizobium sp. AR10]|uniref:hypothetical protein n=1 Tax=Mesorhizobium sp. AR10 TaxID=2865839 RepID=UPI00215EA07B|nr:hypothetical protein [Mesorhizobium sp. AR10]UVK39925.1 hypothetical protein LHFGNBLO_001340 [Mesorhizobium sp. AR10]
MTLQQILAALLNPNGQQQNQLSTAGAPQQPFPLQAITGGAPSRVGDHADPALLMQARQQRASLSPTIGSPQLPPPGQPRPATPPQINQGAPAPQSAPQAPAGANGGGLSGIGDFLQGIFNPHSKGKNETIHWLTQQGLDQGTAIVLAADKPALRSYILQRQKGTGPTEFDQRAQAAQQYGMDPQSEEGRNFILSGKLPESRGGAAELGLQPQTGVDKDGNPVLIQIGKDGNAVQTKMPDGVTLSKTPIKIDAGTEWIILDPVTRQPVGRIPKDLAGEASQKKLGEAQAGAAFDLPRVEQNANQTLSVLERMKTHKGREGSTGFIQGLLPARNSEQVDFQSLVDQTQGQAFLQAFQMLKGAGQITEIEGTKATDAISRLRNQRLGDQDYLQAINDLEGVIKTGLERARVQAGQSSGYTPGSPATTTDAGKRVIERMTNPQPMSGDGWKDLGNGVRIRRKQ